VDEILAIGEEALFTSFFPFFIKNVEDIPPVSLIVPCTFCAGPAKI
jgi:hypothetical protein